jgi:capping protein beta
LVADEEEPGQEGVESANPLPERLRKLEVLANKAFDSYRSQYYIGGICSVYFWPTSIPPEGEPTEEERPESLAFGMALLIKNAVEHEAELKEATWDSIHVIEAEEAEPKMLRLQITSTVLVHLEGDFPAIDSFRLGGHLTRQQEQTIRFTTDADVISGVGRIVEEAENRMRSSLQEIYFGKTHEIVNELRSALPEGFLRNQEGFRQDLKDRVFNMPTA